MVVTQCGRNLAHVQKPVAVVSVSEQELASLHSLGEDVLVLAGRSIKYGVTHR